MDTKGAGEPQGQRARTTVLTDPPNAADPEYTVDPHIPTRAGAWRLQAPQRRATRHLSVSGKRGAAAEHNMQRRAGAVGRVIHKIWTRTVFEVWDPGLSLESAKRGEMKGVDVSVEMKRRVPGRDDAK